MGWLKRKWVARRLGSGLEYWLVTYGLPGGVVLVGAAVVSGFLNGWWFTYELLLSISSPKEAAVPVAGFVVSLGGWLVVPATIGALTGYVVERKITGYRGKTTADVVAEMTANRKK